MPRPTLFLIDGSSQMYRAYHAFRGKGLSNQEGQATHAVYLFVTMLRKLVADHQPAYIAASFDLAGPTFRDELVTDYKANRAAMPDDLVEQITSVYEACEALGVPILTAAGYEADDVIGTMATRAAASDFDVTVVSPDKDFFQLVDDHVRIYDARDDGVWYDAAGVVKKFGVVPSQVVDVLSLVGDASDNVSGVPGVGKKGAIDLISTYGSLDALLEHAGEIKQKSYRETLLAHRAEALRSRELVTIRRDVPLDFEFESLRYQGPSRERCYALFSRLAFRSLMTEFAPTADAVEQDYALVLTLPDLDALIVELRKAGEFALHVIGDRPTAMRAAIVGITFSTGDRYARYLPLGGGEAGENEDLLSNPVTPLVSRHTALDRLKPLLEDATVRKVGHDLKLDSILLETCDIALKGLSVDTMMASYVLDAGRTGHGLEGVSLEHLGYKALTEQDVCGRGAKAMSLARITPEELLTFAGERADLALQLSHQLAPTLVAERLDDVFRQLEMPLVPVLAQIERAGIGIDRASLAAQSRHLEGELARLTARIFELAGQEFNVNSPKQLGEILFDKLQLPAGKKTGKTRSASTAVEVLEDLALVHELPRLVLEWRGLQKLKSTYVDALPALVHPETGRVHTSFNQAVAATGRLSSSDPNLQNIPIRTELGRQIRGAFVAAPGNVLISADYSQIELRVLAHLAEEETLIEAFRNGEDIHDRTAMRVFGTDSELDAHELRRRAKIINYALLYGKTAFTLAKDIGVTNEAAQALIDAYFAGFPRVRGFIDRTLAEARDTGSVKTLFGRRRLMPDLNSRNGQIRARAEREAVNMPIQGTAADILKKAMIDLHGELPKRGLATRMILTVHDELVFEGPKTEAESAVALVRERMEGVASLAVPLTVDVGFAENWRDAKP
ncbi:MAG: DNA polymerase I [Acidobacteria bacterium]|nr:DNA polymerase I [Acidobacteriota bacterium]